MNYKVIALEEFQKEVKKLFKKYKLLKNDILQLIDKLEENYDIGINLGNNLYKIRIKNSSTNNGKSGGYRVIYYTKLSNNQIYLMSIFSKSEKENIDISKLKPLLKKLS